MGEEQNVHFTAAQLAALLDKQREEEQGIRKERNKQKKKGSFNE